MSKVEATAVALEESLSGGSVRGLMVVLLAIGWVGMSSTGCAVPRGSSVQAKRNSVLEMRSEALPDFYAANPNLRNRVRSAAGYGVFTNFGLKIMVVGTGQGYGVVTDNSTGRNTYMRMAQLGGGVGMGAKDYRTLIIFTDRAVMKRFVEGGSEIGGKAEGAAKYQGEGADVSMGVNIQPGMEIYVLTKTGAALEAMVTGAKYWPDDELN